MLGYIALLEGYPPDARARRRAGRGNRLRRATFRTLDAHETLDQGHRDELDAAIDALQLTFAQEDVLGLSALSSVAMMTRVIDEVVSRAPA